MSTIFSIPLFFIIFRETLEASIIISVLLSLVENLVDRGGESGETTLVSEGSAIEGSALGEESRAQRKARLIKRMRIQIWAGAGVGLLIALCIGAAFIAVFFTTLSDIWAKSEELWEGSFSLLACLIIFVMGITMLRIDRSKIRWRAKLEGAFDPKVAAEGTDADRKEGKSGKWILFTLPLITVLREGLEAVVFVGGVSLGQSAKSIPLASIVGLICGLIVGYLIYASSSRLNLSIFLVVSTNVLLLLGAGLFSKAVGDFEKYKYNSGVGADVAEAGDGPGSYEIVGNVWHLPYGNPSNQIDGQGWGVFNAILGWTNNATLGSILSYVFYWLAVIAVLVYMKWSEGRVALPYIGHSEAGLRRAERAENKTLRSESASFEDKKVDGDEEKNVAKSVGSETVELV